MTKHSLNINETVVLLGAGASAEAGIMTSADMLNHIEAKVRSDPDWEKFNDLYFLVKGYSTGAAIAFPSSSRTVFHVESLVDILQGIDGIHLSLLYPFLGGWAPPLESICRQRPGLAGEFSRQIFLEVRKLLTPRKKSSSAYFESLGSIARESGFPIRVFSLNYDLCVEKACSKYRIQRGFGEETDGAIEDDADRTWDWNNFDELSTESVDIVLYKLHGSLDWMRERKDIQAVDSHESISFSNSVMIFGGGAKLKSVDPYLFNVYEFRRWTMAQMRRLVTIGYSFSDGYINELIQQAFQSDPTRELLVIGRSQTMSTEETKRRAQDLRTSLNLPEQVFVQYLPDGAKGFLEKATVEKIASGSSRMPF